MREAERIISEVAALLERDTRVDLHEHPVRLVFENGRMTMEGDVADVRAKKVALELAAAHPLVRGIVDRLHVAPAMPMEDSELRDHVCNALVAEQILAPAIIRAMVKGAPEIVRGGEEVAGCIDVSTEEGIVTLNGRVDSLSRKRLAGVLAWWVPGSRDVVNGLEVTPIEEDNDDEIVDAVRLVLEKDSFVNASQVRVICKNCVVTLMGLVPNDIERRMAEADAWCVFGVDRVENLLETEE